MYSLKAELREKKEASKGYVKAILYGPQLKENILLKVKKDEFEKLYKSAGQTSLIELENNKKKYTVLIHDFQTDPLKGHFIHIDFYSPDLKEKIEAEIPIELQGTAPAVALQGTLIQSLNILHVKALPKNLPHKIEIDVSSLKTFEDFIDVSSIKLGKEVEILTNKEEVVASVLKTEDKTLDEEKLKDEETPKDEDKEE